MKPRRIGVSLKINQSINAFLATVQIDVFNILKIIAFYPRIPQQHKVSQ